MKVVFMVVLYSVGWETYSFRVNEGQGVIDVAILVYLSGGRVAVPIYAPLKFIPSRQVLAKEHVAFGVVHDAHPEVAMRLLKLVQLRHARGVVVYPVESLRVELVTEVQVLAAVGRGEGERGVAVPAHSDDPVRALFDFRPLRDIDCAGLIVLDPVRGVREWGDAVSSKLKPLGNVDNGPVGRTCEGVNLGNKAKIKLSVGVVLKLLGSEPVTHGEVRGVPRQSLGALNVA